MYEGESMQYSVDTRRALDEQMGVVMGSVSWRGRFPTLADLLTRGPASVVDSS